MRRSFRKWGQKKAGVEEAAPSRPRSRARSRPSASRPASRPGVGRTKKEEDAAAKIQEMFRNSLKKKAVERDRALVQDRIKSRRNSAGDGYEVQKGCYAGLPSARDTRYEQRKADAYDRAYGPGRRKI